MSDTIRLALLQIAPDAAVSDATAGASMERGSRRLARWIEACGPLMAPDIWVAPSLALTGHRRKDRGVSLDVVLDPVESAFSAVIAALRQHGGVLATSAQERLDALGGDVVHSALLLDGRGVRLRSPKVQDYGAPGMHAVREMLDRYRRAFGPQAIWPMAEVCGVRVACLVGSESLVPEVGRSLAQRGADIVLLPLSGAADADRPLPFDVMQQGLAYANGVFVASAGAPGEWLDGSLDTSRYAPRSQVIGPDGSPVAGMDGEGEGVLLVELEVSAIAAARARQSADTTPAWELYADLYARSNS